MSQLDKVAKAPFDKPIATSNVILLSCDGIHFHVSKDVLLLASSFFRDMLSLKQPIKSDISVVPVSEDSKTLDYLLRLCYPVIPPTTFSDLSDLHKALRAAIKYDMDKCVWVLKRELRTLGTTDAPRMFAIACTLHLEDEALAAADIWSKQWQRGLPYHRLVSTGYRQEMDQISAGSFRRFLLYVQSGTTKLGPLCVYKPPLTPLNPFGPTKRESPQEEIHVSQVDIGTIYNATPDVILRSKDGINILAHRSVLSMISPTNTLLPISTANDNVSIVVRDDNGITLIKLLQLCYPLGRTRFTSVIEKMSGKSVVDLLEQDMAVYDAAIKYQLGDDIKETALIRIMEHVSSNPLKVFFVSISLGRVAEAQIAARSIVTNTSLPLALEDLYDGSMETDGSAKHYRDLISYLNETCTFNFEHLSDFQVPMSLAVAPIPASVVLKTLQQEYSRYRSDCRGRGAFHMTTMEQATRTTKELIDKGRKQQELQPIPLIQLELDVSPSRLNTA